MTEAVVVAGEEARRPDGVLRQWRGRRIEIDAAQAGARRLDVLGRRVPLGLAGELRPVMPSSEGPLDVGVGWRAVLVEGRLHGLVDDALTGVAQLAPLGDALARDAKLVIGYGPVARISGNGILPQAVSRPRHVPPGLRGVDLVGHPDLGALDHGQAVGLGLVGGLLQLGVVQRSLGRGAGFEHLGRGARRRAGLGPDR